MCRCFLLLTYSLSYFLSPLSNIPHPRFFAFPPPQMNRHATLPLPILILNFLFLFLVRINESMNQRHYDITNLATPPQIQARREQVHSTNHDPRTTQPHNHAFFSLLPVFFSQSCRSSLIYTYAHMICTHMRIYGYFFFQTHERIHVCIFCRCFKGIEASDLGMRRRETWEKWILEMANT